MSETQMQSLKVYTFEGEDYVKVSDLLGKHIATVTKKYEGADLQTHGRVSKTGVRYVGSWLANQVEAAVDEE